VSNWKPWKVAVRYWKKDEYLSWHETFSYQSLNYLFALHIMLMLFRCYTTPTAIRSLSLDS
jgi:hypothetical protein